MKNRLTKEDIWISLSFAGIGILFSLLADSYLLYVATSWIIFGLLGLSLDLVWGKGGVLSLGQTIFYGLGGYGGAIVAINFYSDFGNTFLLALPTAILIGALVSTLIGSIMFYGRVGQLQMSILTYTLTLICWTFGISFSIKIGEAVIGGDNGMSNIPEMILNFGQNAQPLSERAMFLSTLFLGAASLLFSQFLMRTPFGKVIECIRLDMQKTELLGYDVRQYQTVLFGISGGLAGMAGALFALWGNYLNPNIFSVSEALLVPIYVLTGGLGTLIGPFVGAIAVGSLSFFLGGTSGGQATLILGAVLILMVVFFDKGLVGVFTYIINKIWGLKKISENSLSVNLTDLDSLFQKKDAKLLKTEKLYKSFGGVVPIDYVSLKFKTNDVSCIIGPNGAGKSSFLKTCMGVYKPEKGKVYLGNDDITTWPLSKRVQKGLGIKMQKPQIFKTFTVKENIWIAAYARSKNKTKANEITKRVLKVLGVEQQQHKLADILSHGEQQWLDTSMVLSLSPDVILFDEPAAGMTKMERKQLSDLIVNLARYKTIVLVEHDMDFIKSLDAHVTVLHQGRVFAEGSMDDLHRDDRILDIYLGRGQNVGN